MSAWTHDDIATLRADYGTATNARLAKKLQRSVAEIEAKASELALAKDKRKFPGTLKMPRWSAADTAKLKRIYSKRASRDVAIALGRSKKSIDGKAKSLGLMKSPDRRVEVGRQNVRIRYERNGAGATKAKR